MSKFEVFLTKVLKVIFAEAPFNQQRAEENLAQIQISQNRLLEEKRKWKQ